MHTSFMLKSTLQKSNDVVLLQSIFLFDASPKTA